MAVMTERIPVGDPHAQAREVRFGRALVTMILAVFAAAGWVAGRGLLVTGWVAGRAWLITAFLAETVAYGFRQGAGLPVTAARKEEAPAGSRPGKL